MNVLKIIILCICIIAINNIAVLGYAINSDENYWEDIGSLYSSYGEKMKKTNGVHNKAVVVLVPVEENANRDRTNEEDSKSITHPPGHKTKRCKSLTSLQKARLSASLKAVNNDESKLQSGNFMNKNEAAYSNSKYDHHEPKLPHYISDTGFDHIRKSMIRNIPMERYEENIYDNSNNEYNERRDDSSAREKKYICYCVEEGCINDHTKPPYSSYRTGKNLINLKQLENDDIYSHLTALTFQNSQEDNSPLGGLAQQEAHFSTMPNVRREKKKYYGKRLKDKKCTPFIIPCNINDNPTKFTLPLDIEKITQEPSTINPYYQPPLLDNYESINQHSNSYYGNPYALYPPPLGNQHKILEQSQLIPNHEIIYNNPYIAAAQQGSPSSTLDECINLYGRTYCIPPDYYQQQHTSPPDNLPHINSQWNSYYASTESPYNNYAQFDYTNDEKTPEPCNQNGNDNVLFYGNSNSHSTPILSNNINNNNNNNKYIGYDENSAGYDNYLGEQMNTGIVDSSTEYIIKDTTIHQGQIPQTDSYLNQQQEITLKPDELQHDEKQAASILHSSDKMSTEPNRIFHNNNADADISTESILMENNLSKITAEKLPILQPDYNNYYNTESQAANMKILSSSEILSDTIDDDDEHALLTNHDENIENSSELPSSGSLENPYIDILSSEEALLNNENQPDQSFIDSEVSSDFEGEQQNIDESTVSIASHNYDTYENYAFGEGEVTMLPLEPIEDISLSKPNECESPEIINTSADKDLKDLAVLTGLSIEDSKLLRGIIYNTINTLASDTIEPIEEIQFSSPCTPVLGAPEPGSNPSLGDVRIVNDLFNIPAVRNLAISTIRTLLPQVTGISGSSSLGKLTDNVIATGLNIVLGGGDFANEPIEPELALSNEPIIGASIPETIYAIINSIIARPGIGLNGVRLPGIQNIIVRTIQNILAGAKNMVDNSIIWEVLNNIINQEGGLKQIERKPTIPKQIVPQIDVKSDGSDTKPLPYIPITEHYIKNGEWYEGSATIGYKGEFPEAKTPIVPLGMAENEKDYSENNDYIVEESSDEALTNAAEQENIPIKYHSPEDIVLDYIKNHSNDESSLEIENPSTMHHLEKPITEGYSNQEVYNDNEAPDGIAIQDNQTVRVPTVANIHEVTTERFHKTYTKTRKYYTVNGNKVSPTDELTGNANGCSAARIENPRFFGKIVSDANADSISSIEDLEGSNLYYIGDGVKLPLTIKRLNDGSFGLSLSDRICQSFVEENCPCCVPKVGNVIQEPFNSGITKTENNEEVRSSRHARKNLHSRRIRSTTSNGDETVGNSLEIEKKGIPIETVMPVERFVEKYNLTLNLQQFNKNNGRIITNSIDRKNNNDEVRKSKMPNKAKSNQDIEQNQYIEDLLSIEDVPVNDRAALVINALDGLLNSSISETDKGPSEEMQTENGFEYQIDNPIMQRIKHIKDKQLEHGKYRYQQNFQQAAKIRMEVAKNILHWLRDLIIKLKANAIS